MKKKVMGIILALTMVSLGVSGFMPMTAQAQEMSVSDEPQAGSESDATVIEEDGKTAEEGTVEETPEGTNADPAVTEEDPAVTEENSAVTEENPSVSEEEPLLQAAGADTGADTVTDPQEGGDSSEETWPFDETRIIVTGIEDKDYTGNKEDLVQTITVTDTERDDINLMEGADYEVTCENDITSGTGKVTLTGIGSYEGTIEKTFTITDKTPKVGPVTMKSAAVPSKTAVKIIWNKVNGAKTYKIYGRQKGTAAWKLLASATGTSYTYKTNKNKLVLTWGKFYQFGVVAYDDNGTTLKDTAKIKSVKQVCMKPAAVTTKTAKSQKTGIKVTWSKAANAQKYFIYRKKKGAKKWSFLKAVGNAKTSYTDTTVQLGTSYTYMVRAIWQTGDTKSYGSFTKNGKTALAKSVSAPVLRSVEPKQWNQVTVSWAKRTGVDGYVIYRKTNSGGWQWIATVAAGKSSYTDTKINMSLAAVYTYTVKGYKKAGGKTYYSAYDTAGLKYYTPYYTGIIDRPEAYYLLNDFRTTEKIWVWNADNKTKTYYNTNSKNQLQPVKRDPKLEKIAQTRAKEITKKFDHTRPNGENVFSMPYNGFISGENIAMATDSALYTMYLWAETNSTYEWQGHRRNMLGDHTKVGIACYLYQGYGYWVQVFGR